MAITNMHHVAYRCNDAQETVDFYNGLLEMPYVMAISEDRVPSTGEEDPYMHIFFDSGAGGCLAFFELPSKPPVGKDPTTPDWVQHIAFQVEDRADLDRYHKKLKEAGLDVVGPTDHGIFHSIYFFDPNGHRIELTHHHPEPGVMDKLREIAPEMLEEWNKTKKTSKKAAFLHEQAFANIDTKVDA